MNPVFFPISTKLSSVRRGVPMPNCLYAQQWSPMIYREDYTTRYLPAICPWTHLRQHPTLRRSVGSDRWYRMVRDVPMSRAKTIFLVILRLLFRIPVRSLRSVRSFSGYGTLYLNRTAASLRFAQLNPTWIILVNTTHSCAICNTNTPGY